MDSNQRVGIHDIGLGHCHPVGVAFEGLLVEFNHINGNRHLVEILES